MTWVRSAVSEDVFDENADEMDLAQKQWKRDMEKRVKEGYREGVETGKVLTLQQGFNQGYKEAVTPMFECGQLKGTISALLSWCHHNKHNSAMLSEMTDLLSQVRRHEEYVLKNLNCINQPSHVGGLLDALNDIDLGHELFPAEQGNGTSVGRHSGNYYRDDNGTGSFQSECCRRTEGHKDSERTTLIQLKERMSSIMEQLGFSPAEHT